MFDIKFTPVSPLSKISLLPQGNPLIINIRYFCKHLKISVLADKKDLLIDFNCYLI